MRSDEGANLPFGSAVTPLRYTRARGRGSGLRSQDFHCLLLEDALRDEVPELVSGRGLAVAARHSTERLMRDGWTHGSYRRALDEGCIGSAAARESSRLWDRLHEWAPEWDAGAVYRTALSAGRVARAPRLLLVELGVLAGDLKARYLARLVAATEDAGGISGRHWCTVKISSKPQLWKL